MTDKTFTSDDFRKWGKKGGSKKGETKRRGDSEYYRQMRLKALLKKKEATE
jgi:hypothetical protein